MSHFTREVHRQKVDQTKPKAKEMKILNIESNQLEGTDVNTLILNVLATADAFKHALKQLKTLNESNVEQKKEIFTLLADMQNMIKLKILHLKTDKGKNTEGESSKTRNTQSSKQSSTQSLLNNLPELSSKKSSSPESTRKKSVDSKPESLISSKLMSLSKQSLCSIKSSQCDYMDDDVFDDNNDDDDEKFKEFLENVTCPFCLKREDNKNSLVKHLDACTTFKNKKFVKTLDCPYSVFQLLPNNTFKCNICPNLVQSNLKKYFEHSQNEIHISNYNKAVSRKNYTESIFCASCKIQIPNSATHIKFHIGHEVHQRNRRELRSNGFYRQSGIHCVYSREKKFKCLYCPPGSSVHKSLKEILQHLESEAHARHVPSGNNQRQKKPAMYCMFCLAEVNVFNVIWHFDSSGHAQKEREDSLNEFELCFYCGFKCSDLNLLALHFEKCPALDLIREEDGHQECEEFDGVSTETEKDQKRPARESTSEKGRCIIVKDYPKILELYHYFNQYGEVLGIEQSGENAVMIKFQEEKTVDRILERGRDIEIKGVKLKITRTEDVDGSDMKLESSRTSESTNSPPVANDGGSDLNLAIRNVVCVNSSVVPEDFSKVAMDGGTLESLFNRVSSHLSYTVLKPDCEDFSNIAHDCETILKSGKCHPVGFLKCGLSFPVEKFTLYYESSDSLIKEQRSNDNGTSLTESILYNENMCRKCINQFKTADVVSRVSLREKSFPLVEFYHKKTSKWCTITFRQSDSILADELRFCLNDQKLRSFVLIIRFWLSVHRLEIREFESVIISLLLFFLLSSGVVSTSSENFKKKRGHLLLNDLVAKKVRLCQPNFEAKFCSLKNAYSLISPAALLPSEY